MNERLAQLRLELGKGRQRLEMLDRERQEVRDTMLRISGAIRVLEELLAQNGPQAVEEQGGGRRRVSQTDVSGEARVFVGRWSATYLVPAAHPSPEELRHRLDRCLTEQLPEFCSSALAGFLESGRADVWRIRELKLDLSVEATLLSQEEAAKNWGEVLASRVALILRQEDQTDSILHFEDRAVYLAQFILDLAAGRAWGKWYYEEFESLRSLSGSQALGEAFAREPEQAAFVFLRLAIAHRLEEVLCAVTENDARKIYLAVFPNGATRHASDESLWVGRILELWIEEPLLGTVQTAARHRDALRLLARAALRYPGAEMTPAVKMALDGLLELREVLAALRSPGALDLIIAALARQDLAGAIDLAVRAEAANSRVGLEFFSRAMDGDVEWGKQAAGVVLSDKWQAVAARRGITPRGEPVLSVCGGVFLLGPSFLELDVAAMVAAATEPADETRKAASVLRQFLAVKCLGRIRSSETMSDPAPRWFSGFTGSDLLGDTQTLSPNEADLERIQSRLLQSLTARDRCNGRFLLAEAVSLPFSTGEALLIRDLLQNQWAYLATLPVGDFAIDEAVAKGVALVSKSIGNEPEILLLGGGLNALKDSSLLSRCAAQVISFDPHSGFSWDAPAKQFAVRPEQLARSASPAASDLAYFSLAGLRPEKHINTNPDLTWSLVARAVLRHFARRLPGFESSSPEHLYQNFLAGVSTVRNTSERVEVRLPQCPLALVLRLSGVWDKTYALPWLDGREICLLPPVE